MAGGGFGDELEEFGEIGVIGIGDENVGVGAGTGVIERGPAADEGDFAFCGRERDFFFEAGSDEDSSAAGMDGERVTFGFEIGNERGDGMVDLAGDLVEREGVGDLLAAAEAVALKDGRLAGGEAFESEIGDAGLRDAGFEELIDGQAESGFDDEMIAGGGFGGPAADGGAALDVASVNEAFALVFDEELGGAEDVRSLAGGERGPVPFDGLVGIEEEGLLLAAGGERPAVAIELGGDGGGDDGLVKAASVIGMGVGEPGGGDGRARIEPQADGGQVDSIGRVFDLHEPLPG